MRVKNNLEAQNLSIHKPRITLREQADKHIPPIENMLVRIIQNQLRTEE